MKINGHSNPDGFMIKVNFGQKEKIFFTQDYERGEEKKEKYHKKISLVCLLLYIISSICLSLQLPLNKWDIIFASLFPCAYLTAFIAQIFNTDGRKWHCCEHKIANIFLQEKDISKETICKESFYNEFCGAVCGLESFIPATLYIYLRVAEKGIIASLSMTALCLVILYFYNRAIMTKIGVSYFLQMIFTREPEEKMFDEALALAHEVRQWINH